MLVLRSLQLTVLFATLVYQTLPSLPAVNVYSCHAKNEIVVAKMFHMYRQYPK